MEKLIYSYQVELETNFKTFFQSKLLESDILQTSAGEQQFKESLFQTFQPFEK